jgi:hypothetical protein
VIRGVSPCTGAKNSWDGSPGATGTFGPVNGMRPAVIVDSTSPQIGPQP